MLDKMPELEIDHIEVIHGNNELIDTLIKKTHFEDKQELFRKLSFYCWKAQEESEPYEYLSYVT